MSFRRMESAYRTWLRARREGLMPQDLDELARELQMALGTAKWQVTYPILYHMFRITHIKYNEFV